MDLRFRGTSYKFCYDQIIQENQNVRIKSIKKKYYGNILGK
jgi:hypothetical protein